MRHVASLLVVSWLGGCSLIYNPSNIGTQQDGAPDAPADAPIDSDPTMISVTGVRPLVITEGQGSGGSRPAVLVIEGTNFVKANTMVSLAPSVATGKIPIVTVDNSQLDVSADGFFITVPVTIDVDERAAAIGLVANDSIALDVTVMQDVSGGTIMKTLPGMLRVAGLDELKGAAPGGGITGGAEHVYSLVQLTGVVKVMAGAGADMPIIIRSTSKLTIDDFTVNGNAKAGGPGGGSGGAGAGLLGGNQAGTGPAGGTGNGVPGGFVGDATVFTLGGNFRGSGGAGGVNILGGAGDGGGGGGSIMLVSGGDLTTGDGTSIGGAPTTGTAQGGGGSGGVIVLRAGRNLTTATMSVAGNGPGAAMGAAGRLRYDAGGTATLAGSPAGFRGPQFSAPPLVVNTDKPMLQVLGTAQTTFKYYITNATGTMTSNAYSVTVPDSGPAVVVNGTDGKDLLSEGLNRICLVAGAGDLTAETRNCIDIAYIGH